MTTLFEDLEDCYSLPKNIIVFYRSTIQVFNDTNGPSHRYILEKNGKN